MYRWWWRSDPGTDQEPEKILNIFQFDINSSIPFPDQIKMRYEKATGNDHVKSATGSR